MEQLPYVIITSLVFIISWIDYKKKVRNASNEDDIRKAFVPLLLVILLFVVSISVFLT